MKWNDFVEKALEESPTCCHFLLKVHKERLLVLKELEARQKSFSRRYGSPYEMQVYPYLMRGEEWQVRKYAAMVGTAALLAKIEEECRCRIRDPKYEPQPFDLLKMFEEALDDVPEDLYHGVRPTGDEIKVVTSAFLLARGVLGFAGLATGVGESTGGAIATTVTRGQVARRILEQSLATAP